MAQAKRRRIPVALTPRAHRRLARMPCHYCGAWSPRSLRGIDRLDSARGYAAANAVACCGPCNYMKSNAPLAAFLARIDAVARRRRPLVRARSA